VVVSYIWYPEINTRKRCRYEPKTRGFHCWPQTIGFPMVFLFNMAFVATILGSRNHHSDCPTSSVILSPNSWPDRQAGMDVLPNGVAKKNVVKFPTQNNMS